MKNFLDNAKFAIQKKKKRIAIAFLRVTSFADVI